MGLFRLDKQNCVLLDEDAYRLIPELRDLSVSALLFICLYVDYDSPFHQFPEEERLRRARRQVYGNDGEGVEKMDHIIKGIASYRSLQYDGRRETIIKYQSKIEYLGNQLLHTKEVREIKDLDTAIERLMDRCEKIQKVIDSEELGSSVQLKGGGKLSFLEKWQKNMVAYKQSEKDRVERTGVEYL